MRNLFIHLSLYRNTRLSVQAVLRPYLRQKLRISQESWVQPMENCSSDSKSRPSLWVGRVSMKRLLYHRPATARDSWHTLSRPTPHVPANVRSNPRTADWGPAAPSVAIHATRRRAHVAAVHSTTVRTESMGGPSWQTVCGNRGPDRATPHPSIRVWSGAGAAPELAAPVRSTTIPARNRQVFRT